jgi:CRP/FNR family transcriptional regulator
LEDVGLKDVPARLASLVLQLTEGEGVITPEGPRIPTHYTHRQLATMIGSNRESVTRALDKLRREGTVQLTNRYIYIRNPEVLRCVAG